MSNRIDFFLTEKTQLALPGATVSVLLDGQLCPYLEVVEIVRSSLPEFSWARLRVNPAAYPNGSFKSIEEVETHIGIARHICICQYYNGIPPGAAAFTVPIFDGQIENIEMRITDKQETVEIIARDFSANLKRITVYGQRVAKGQNGSIFLAGQNTVFNPDGKANASANPIEIDGKSYVIFCAQPSTARLWSYAQVIDYLLCEYLPAGQLHSPTIEQLEALTENQIVRDLDVTGLNLIQALQRCCERLGLKFKFVPRFNPVGPTQAIVFYRDGQTRTVQLNYQPAGKPLIVSKNNISQLRSTKNFWPITHKYIGLGDFKVYEATFELVKAWDPSLEDTDYEKFSPSTNPDFYKVKDVYRKWCLNEAGDYSGPPYNQGDAFDFSKIFGSHNFATRRRRFWPALTTDKQGKSLGYFLQVSFDNGLHWWQYLYAFNNLLDECGIWLSSDQLDANTWVAALKGVLKFRITASVISDERLSCSITDGPVDSAIPVVEQVIMLSHQFKYRKVSSASIFAAVQSANNDLLGKPDEVDDTDALFQFIRKKVEATSGIIETTDIQTPYLTFDYQVGDRISIGPESRDLLDWRSDNRSISWIQKVQMDYQKQCTNLKIARRRQA